MYMYIIDVVCQIWVWKSILSTHHILLRHTAWPDNACECQIPTSPHPLARCFIECWINYSRHHNFRVPCGIQNLDRLVAIKFFFRASHCKHEFKLNVRLNFFKSINFFCRKKMGRIFEIVKSLLLTSTFMRSFHIIINYYWQHKHLKTHHLN